MDERALVRMRQIAVIQLAIVGVDSLLEKQPDRATKLIGIKTKLMDQLKKLEVQDMKPTPKSKEISDFLEDTYGRSTAINSDKCIRPPMGCGKHITEFRDEVSRKEYAISGLCQECQDKIFGK